MLKSFDGLPFLPILNKAAPLIPHKELDDKIIPYSDFVKFEGIAKGVAIKCGNIQTNIECLDFDLKNDNTGTVWSDFIDHLEDVALFSRCYVQSTPSGGYHIVYRSTQPVPPSAKLAYPDRGTAATIETRGKGAYFVCAPTPGYTAIHGDIHHLPVLTQEEIDTLKAACKALNRQPDRTVKKEKISATGRIYNSKMSGKMAEYLHEQGWTIYRDMPDKAYYSRPGKSKGTSGTLFKQSGYFYVFTTGAKFSPDQAYSPYEILRITHGYDYDQTDRAACKEIGDDYIKDIVADILKNEDSLKESELIVKLSDTIIADLEKKGKFYVSGSFAYYFTNKKLTLIDGKSEKMQAFIYGQYKVVLSQSKIKAIFDAIKCYAFINGEPTDIHNYTYFDGSNVYVDNFDGRQWVISCKDITIHDNGYNGVLFVESENTPVEYSDAKIDFSAMLFDGLVFNEDDLQREEQETLIMLWIVSIYFLSDNKPLLAIIGEKGSGKSDLLRNLMMLIFGNTYGFTKVPDKEQDFNNIVTNNKLVIFDNADSYKDYLNDGLAVCATGGTIQIRKLYTTNDNYKAKIDCFVGLTARTPKFTRDDVADRLIMIRLDRMESFVPESQIVKKIRECRNAFMSSVFETIKSFIPHMDKTYDKTVSRMSDFEAFACKVFPEMVDTFKKISSQQKEFSEDIFSEIFEQYCDNMPYGIIQISSKDLCQALIDIAKGLRYHDIKLSSKTVAFKLNNKFPFCKIEKVKLKSGNKTEYKIIKTT